MGTPYRAQTAIGLRADGGIVMVVGLLGRRSLDAFLDGLPELLRGHLTGQ